MPTHAPLITRLLFIVVLFAATGCPQSEQSTPTTTNTNASSPTPAAVDPLPTDYRSHMAFSVDLLDPVTSLPMPADIETLKPTLLREVERITSEPILRQVLNQPEVRGTAWYMRFENNLDDAAQALSESIVARHVPGTPLIRVYALRSLKTQTPEDAQVILQAISDEYLRLKDLAINASINEQLSAAQRARENAEEAVASSAAQLKRHLLNNPVSSSSIERSRLNALETEALQQQLRHAEVRREAAITKIMAIQQQTNGFLGYTVKLEYPPQKAR